MPSATRPCLLGCALVVALALSACGGTSSGSEPPPGAGQPKGPTASPARTPVAGQRCQGQVGGFLGAMDALRRRLAVGVSYEQYVNEVEAVRASYRRIPVERLAFDCLSTAATPGERAFNEYIGAANDWGDCIGEAGCEAATIEPVLQRKWRIASRFVSAAHRGLRDLGAG